MDMNQPVDDVRLSDGATLKELFRPAEGYISVRGLSDPEIYQLELDKVFTKAWVPVGHESEIPSKGDYVLRNIGEDSVIVSRDEHGGINILLNTCMHRGNQICRVDEGNSSHFRCPYHGYTYNNSGSLIGVPAFKEAYGDDLDKTKFSMLQAKVATYDGLIFGTWNDNPIPLEEHLGDFKFYLDLLFQRTEGGMEVIGPPNRWTMKTNWKLGPDNFVGDAYHTMMTHRSAIELGTAPKDPKFAYYGAHVSTEGGHGIGLIGPPPGIPLPPFINLPQELHPLYKKQLSEAQYEALRRSNFVHGNLFPNLSLLNVMTSTEIGNEKNKVPYFTMKLYNPKGPDEVEVMSFVLVEKEASEEHKEWTKKTYTRVFGPRGNFEVDDSEMWLGISRAAKGAIAGRRISFNYQMGINVQPDRGDWPGPGTVYQGDYNEANQRNFWKQWLDMMIK